MAGKYTLQKTGQRIDYILDFFNDLTLPSATGFVAYCNDLVNGNHIVEGNKTFTGNLIFNGGSVSLNNGAVYINAALFED